jgi:hypothetical protein
MDEMITFYMPSRPARPTAKTCENQRLLGNEKAPKDYPSHFHLEGRRMTVLDLGKERCLSTLLSGAQIAPGLVFPSSIADCVTTNFSQ